MFVYSTIYCKNMFVVFIIPSFVIYCLIFLNFSSKRDAEWSYRRWVSFFYLFWSKRKEFLVVGCVLLGCWCCSIEHLRHMWIRIEYITEQYVHVFLFLRVHVRLSYINILWYTYASLSFSLIFVYFFFIWEKSVWFAIWN